MKKFITIISQLSIGFAVLPSVAFSAELNLASGFYAVEADCRKNGHETLKEINGFAVYVETKEAYDARNGKMDFADSVRHIRINFLDKLDEKSLYWPKYVLQDERTPRSSIDVNIDLDKSGIPVTHHFSPDKTINFKSIDAGQYVVLKNLATSPIGNLSYKLNLVVDKRTQKIVYIDSDNRSSNWPLAFSKGFRYGAKCKTKDFDESIFRRIEAQEEINATGGINSVEFREVTIGIAADSPKPLPAPKPAKAAPVPAIFQESADGPDSRSAE